jgi:ElaA protein
VHRWYGAALIERCGIQRMETVVKRFEELTADELYAILRLRVSVFVVEQNCPYQELDGRDQQALHVYFRDAEGLQAYLRVLGSGVAAKEAMLGRVIAVRRGCGLGGRLLSEGIRLARERLGASAIRVEAQTYAKGFYETRGFRQVSEEFLEDGIPHIGMLLE